MGIVKNNIVTEGLSGMIGDVIVFRQVRGKTIVTGRPRRPRFQSQRQRENRARFAEASAFARLAMHDPEKKTYYLAKARKLKLPNAYTAALTDYMRKPQITAIKYKGNNRQTIAITAGKPGFSLASVKVTMVNAQGVPVASDIASLKDRQKYEWTARLTPDLSMTGRDFFGYHSFGEGGSEGGQIMVTVTDHTGNVATKVLLAA